MKKLFLMFLLVSDVVFVSNSFAELAPEAILFINTGVIDGVATEPALGKGSWFSAEIKTGNPIYAAISGFNHIRLGTTQNATVASPNIDYPWLFFGNLGVHQTSGNLNVLTDDDNGNVTLDFSVWGISWNHMPFISLATGLDNGIASLTCYTSLLEATPGTCALGDQFLLTFNGIFFPGDIKGNIKYHLHIEGTVLEDVLQVVPPPCEPCVPFNVTAYLATDTVGALMALNPGATADSVGNTSGIYLKAVDIGVTDPLMNTSDGRMCVGGCFDYIIDNITTDYVDVVIKLNQSIPDGAVFRKLINGQWQDFDVSSSDQIGSALDDGSGNCQGPTGTFNVGLITGAKCLFMRIYDGGPNDSDGVKNGTIVDPGGILLPGSPISAISSASAVPSSGGCSISNMPVTLTERMDWLIVAGFIALLGWLSFKRRCHVG